MRRARGWSWTVVAWAVLCAGPAHADDPPDRAALHARAVQLGLGGATAIMVLFAGQPRPDWIAAAGGPAETPTLQWPLEGGRPGRCFGTGWQGRHRALDLIAPRGTPILAAERGIVAYAAWGLRGYGAAVILIHPSGWVTLYAHASEVLVHTGQTVVRGQTIARVGRTGNAGGDHLHFELRQGGATVDPAALLVGLPAGVTVAAGPAIPPGNVLWKVRRGQTVRWIARRLGIPAETIRALNGLDASAVVRPGTRILVPEPVRAPPRRRPRGRRR